MQNTYQEKLADLEVNNSKKIKKLEGGINFKIKSDFQPSGDQPEAVSYTHLTLPTIYSV